MLESSSHVPVYSMMFLALARASWQFRTRNIIIPLLSMCCRLPPTPKPPNQSQNTTFAPAPLFARHTSPHEGPLRLACSATSPVPTRRSRGSRRRCCGASAHPCWGSPWPRSWRSGVWGSSGRRALGELRLIGIESGRMSGPKHLVGPKDEGRASGSYPSWSGWWQNQEPEEGVTEPRQVLSGGSNPIPPWSTSGKNRVKRAM